MNKKDLEEYHKAKIEEYEEANPDAKGLKHTFFVLEYKSAIGFTRVTRIISHPQDVPDKEVDEVARNAAIYEPPVLCRGSDLISVHRGSAMELLYKEILYKEMKKNEKN